MSENEEKKNTAAELPDEALDMVAGGSGGDHVQIYCPYCRTSHRLCRRGVQTMRSGKIAEAYECGKHGLFYKVNNIYFDRSGRNIH